MYKIYPYVYTQTTLAETKGSNSKIRKKNIKKLKIKNNPMLKQKGSTTAKLFGLCWYFKVQ